MVDGRSHGNPNGFPTGGTPRPGPGIGPCNGSRAESQHSPGKGLQLA